ncbi:Tyrosinase 7 [Botrytis cinerea]
MILATRIFRLATTHMKLPGSCPDIALKGQYNYTEHLSYWDWELDWSDIEISPIWDSEDGFGSDGTGDPKKDQFVTSRFHPSSLQKAFNSPDYRGFSLALEDGAHRDIPVVLLGEFGSFTSPNDPIFLLHHTKADRLWWEWQKVGSERRLRDYGRQADTIESSREASINDLLHVGGLGRAIAVSDIMSTET